MRPLQRPSAPLCLWDPSAVCRRSYMDRTFLLATLCTPERQSLCESHRQRRWLTYWSYLQAPKLAKESGPYGQASRYEVMVMLDNFPKKGGSMGERRVHKSL